MKSNVFLFAALTHLLIYLSPSCAAERWPELELRSAIAAVKPASEAVSIVKDPVYQSGKRYQAYPLRLFISKLGKRYSGNLDQAVLVFIASDGYKVSMSYPDALEEDGYIAFRDLDAFPDDWADFEFGREKINPAPYYLVWRKPGIDKWRYPWPFQLARISLQPATVYYGQAAPIEKKASVTAGFAEFGRYCIRCHAVNGSGGTVGPELNSPQNVSELYSDNQLKKLILNNRNNRPNSKMPIFDTILTGRQIDNIMSYLKAMKMHKVGVDNAAD